MTESTSDMSNSVSSPPKNSSRITGCGIYALRWQLIASLCGLLVLILFTSSDNNILPTLASTLYLVFPCIFIIGHLAALALGLWLGRQWWPGFYLWLENRPVMVSIIPGAISAMFFALIAVWATALVIDSRTIPGETFGPGASLIAMFALTPAALLLAPIVGAVGGVLAALAGNRFTTKAHHLIFGTLGGAITGLAFSAVLYGLLYLMQ